MEYHTFEKFEKERQNLFKDVVSTLRANGNWGIKCNERQKEGRFEADAIITRDERAYALVEIKRYHRNLNIILNNVRRTAHYYKCEKIFVVFDDVFFYFDINNTFGPLSEVKLDKQNVQKYLLNDFQNSFKQEEWENFFTKLSEDLSEDIKRKNEVSEVLREISQCKCSIDKETDLLKIPDVLEEKFFRSLIEEYQEDVLCRFTSLGSLFRAINEKKQSMCSIVCMNDKSETNYVSNYLLKNNYIQTKLHPGTVGDANQSFILSCCSLKKKDDLTMMRLYADDARGVVICYKILNPIRLKTSSNFILRKINYERENGTHPELDLIGRILKKQFGGYSLSLQSLLKWSHFFKPKEYTVEEEVRLLYIDSGIRKRNCVESKWIHDSNYNILSQLRLFDISNDGLVFPFAINSIILAPKMTESSINREQIETIIHCNNIKIDSQMGQNIVDLSGINHYR